MSTALARLRGIIANVQKLSLEVAEMPGEEAHEIVALLGQTSRSLSRTYAEMESWPVWMGDVVDRAVARLEADFGLIINGRLVMDCEPGTVH